MSMISSLQTASLIEIELAKLIIAIVLGGIIGWQREYTGHEAGIRTFSSICMGSCLFGIISQNIEHGGDPGRIAAQVVSGIGFIGIGVIIREGGSIKGLTTAATLWSMSAIGLAIAFNLHALALLATTLIFVSLFLSRTKLWNHIVRRPHDQPPQPEQTVKNEGLFANQKISENIMPKEPFIPLTTNEVPFPHNCCHHNCSSNNTTNDEHNEQKR